MFFSYLDESCEWYCSSLAISSVESNKNREQVCENENNTIEGNWVAHSPRSFAHCIFFCSTNDSSRFKLSLWSLMIIALHNLDRKFLAIFFANFNWIKMKNMRRQFPWNDLVSEKHAPALNTRPQLNPTPFQSLEKQGFSSIWSIYVELLWKLELFNTENICSKHLL